MSEMAQTTEEAGRPRKAAKLPLLLGLLGFLLMAGGGFAAAYSGLLPLGGSKPGKDHAAAMSGHGDEGGEAAQSGDLLKEIAFVPVDPVVINLGRAGRDRHLKFRAELEVLAGGEEQVRMLMPRIVDVINGYLRAIGIEQLEEPAALIRLRAQLLRRIQLVTGGSNVRDLLVMEFVLN